jgi:hypothetical protein
MNGTHRHDRTEPGKHEQPHYVTRCCRSGREHRPVFTYQLRDTKLALTSPRPAQEARA